MEIINYTRYSTEDLKNIVSFVEGLEGFHNWRAQGPLTFSEFDPKNPYITTRAHRWNKALPLEKRYVAKMRWSDMNSISLLTPRKIFENPLQALTADDATPVPADMMEQIYKRLRDCANCNRVSLALPPGVTSLRLRILEKPETKKPKSDPHKVQGARKEYIKRNLRHFGWESRQAARALTKSVQRDIKAAEHHLRGEKDRLDSVHAAYADAIAALARLDSIINATEASI